MEPGRCHRYLFAAVVILTALFAAPQAQAHNGPHAQLRHHGVVGKTMEGVAHATASVSSPADPQMAQCGVMMCCGNACSPGGCVIVGDALVPLPSYRGSTVLPGDAPPSSGRDSEGLRRPPRV